MAVLWLIYEVASLASAILALLEPNVLKQFLNTGEMGGMEVGLEVLLLFAVLLLVPLLMAFLSLTLKNPTNRWASIILSIVYIGLSLTDLPMYLEKPYAYAILMWLAGLVTLALIAWYAWKSKKEE